MPKYRLYLSRVLNMVFRRGLSMPIRDLSSGFRLYRRSVFAPDTLKGRDFDLLEEILVKAFSEGWRVQEIPFDLHATRTWQLFGTAHKTWKSLSPVLLGSLEAT